MANQSITKGDAMPEKTNPEIESVEVTVSLPMTPTQFAAAYNYDAKSVRARMRKITDRENQPGSGGRWVIDSLEFHDRLLADMRAPHNRRIVSATLKQS